MISLILTGLIAFNPGFDFLVAPKSPFLEEPAKTGIASLEINPAGLMEPGNWLYAYQNMWLLDTKTTSLGLKTGSWGLGLSYVDFGTLEFQDESPSDDGGPTFRPFAFTSHLGKGLRIDDELWVGVGLTYFYQKIHESSAQNVLLDVGARYAPEKAPFLTVGAAVRHFGLKAKFEGVQYKMPTEVLGGAEGTYDIATLGYAYRKILTYDEETVNSEEHRVYVSVDLPHGIRPTISYAYGRDVDPFAFSLAFAFKKLHFGYTYRLTKYSFDAPHLFGLRYQL
jgi:hypothetical protein